MTIDQVKTFFVTWRNVMRQLELSENCYQHWQRQGYIPYHQQKRLEKLSYGILKADENVKRSRGNADRETARRASEANQRRAGTLK